MDSRSSDIKRHQASITALIYVEISPAPFYLSRGRAGAWGPVEHHKNGQIHVSAIVPVETSTPAPSITKPGASRVPSL